MRIAIQGTHASYSQQAALKLFPEHETVACREALEVVAAVQGGRADAGCLPIENSLVGGVTTTYDLLHEAFGTGGLRLTNEVLLAIHHCLLGVPGSAREAITRVFSHPVALGQCGRFLRERLPGAELVSAWDTAGSAEMVARSADPTHAAIGPLAAARAYGLDVLAEQIEDDPSNQTRFLVFTSDRGPAPARRPVPHKTSLLVSLPHRPGSLAATLQAFAVRGLNLAALQSRPEPSAPFTYRFYIDVEGAAGEPLLDEALAEIRRLAVRVIVLGTYEAAQ